MFNQLQFSLKHTGMIDFGMHMNMVDKPSVDRDSQFLDYAPSTQSYCAGLVTIPVWHV